MQVRWSLTIGLIAVAIAAVGVSTYLRLKDNIMETALLDTRGSLRSMAILYEMKVGGVTLKMNEGDLTTVNRASIGTLLDHDLVDRTVAANGGVATIFETKSGEYVRISTNLKMKRVKELLAPSLPAITRLSRRWPRASPISVRQISSARAI